MVVLSGEHFVFRGRGGGIDNWPLRAIEKRSSLSPSGELALSQIDLAFQPVLKPVISFYREGDSF